MIVYLAGPITGVEGYEKQFQEAKQQLEGQGHIVLDPSVLPKGLGDCDQYMRLCLPMIDMADSVAMLPGWKNSLGACREWGYATALDKLVFDCEVIGDGV